MAFTRNVTVQKGAQLVIKHKKMKISRIVAGALLGILMVLGMSQVSSAQEPIGKMNFYVEGTRWTELRLDMLKYSSWFTENPDGTFSPNYEKTEYYVKGDTVMEELPYARIWRRRDGEPDTLVYLFGEQRRDKWQIDLVSFYNRRGYERDRPLEPCPTYFSNWGIGAYVRTNGLPTYLYTGGRITKSMGTIREIRQGTFGTDVPLTYMVLDDNVDVGMEACEHIVIPGIGITSWYSRNCISGPCMAHALEGVEEDQYIRNDHYRSILVHFERGGEVLYDLWPTPEGGLASHVQGVKAGSSPNNQAVYDLQGRKVEGKPSRGIYVIGGKKRVVR